MITIKNVILRPATVVSSVYIASRGQWGQLIFYQRYSINSMSARSGVAELLVASTPSTFDMSVLAVRIWSYLLHVSLAESGKSLVHAWRVKCGEVEWYWVADPMRQGCVICEIVSRERVHEHDQPRRLQNGNNLVQIRLQEVNLELRIRVRANLVISHLANKD